MLSVDLGIKGTLGSAWGATALCKACSSSRHSNSRSQISSCSIEYTGLSPSRAWAVTLWPLLTKCRATRLASTSSRQSTTLPAKVICQVSRRTARGSSMRRFSRANAASAALRDRRYAVCRGAWPGRAWCGPRPSNRYRILTWRSSASWLRRSAEVASGVAEQHPTAAQRRLTLSGGG